MSHLLVEELRKAITSLKESERVVKYDARRRYVLKEKINNVCAALMKGVTQSLTEKEKVAYRQMVYFEITPVEACRVLLSVEKPNMTFVKNIYEFYELNKYKYYDYYDR